MMKFSALTTLWRLGPQRLAKLFYHLPNFLKLFWRLLMDARIPLWSKLPLILLLLYVVSPIDLMPDFLFGLGQIDDLVIVFLGLQLFVRLCPPEVVREHVRAIALGR